MIIDVQKVVFVGSQDVRDQFFKRAQKEGIIEFIHSKRSKKGELPKPLQDTLKAIKVLKKQPVADQYEEAPDVDRDELVTEVLHAKELHDGLEEKRRYLFAEIARVYPLGDFSLEQLREIGSETGLRFRFFAIKSSKLEKVDLPPELYHISSEYGMEYFISVSKKEVQAPEFLEIHTEQSLSTLYQDLDQVQAEYSIVHEELKELAAYLDILKLHLINQSNAFNIIHAIDGTELALDDALFFVEGWIPKNKLRKIEAVTKGLPVLSDVVAVEESDIVPTYMENTGLSAVGEDLVHIYDTPATTDKDPSIWVLWAFSFFFAMIVSDAGYGMLYLLGGLFVKWRFKKLQGMARRFVTMVLMIASFCVGWGVLTGSYFGIDLSPQNPANSISLLHLAAVKKAEYHMSKKDDVYQFWTKKFPKLTTAKTGQEFLVGGVKEKEGKLKYEIVDEFNDNILIEFSILVGVIHICLSLFRYLLRDWAGIGWVSCIIGGYLFFPSMLKGTSMMNFLGVVSKTNAEYFGLQMLFGGVAVAMILALIQHKKGGIGEITKGIQIFADILSYLRLYALGLAGMILASTFNDMGEMVGYAIGSLIIVVGHGTNMILGLMGGTIHGLRLNFLEWYHYCFVGGGKLFNPLKLLKRSTS